MKLQMANPQRQKEKVYIGCGAGFGGNQPVAALKLLQRVKELDYLVLECLAERTLADRYQAMKSGGKGYDPCKVITSAEFYPIYCNILAYSSSTGSIHLVDIWQSVLCDSHSKLAPELLLGAEQYSTVIDTWSLGCIIVEMLSKEPLFNGKTEVDQIDKIFRILGTPNETIWEGFSELPGVKVNFVKHPCIGCDNRRDISMGTVVVSMKTGDRYSQIVEEHAMKYTSPPWVISMERSSPSSSCVSRELSPDEEFLKKTAMSMMLMGCPGCLINRKDQTPQEAWSRRKLSAKHLRIFGSITYAHVPHQGRDKLDDRSVSHGIGRARRLRKKIYDFLSYFEDEEEKDTVTLVQDATPPLSPGNIASPSSQDQSSSERSQRMESIQELYDGIEEVTNFDFLCCLFADSESMNFNKVVTDKR
ncbi:hypothetical protein T459_01874 [Capsicum annuum]|uniref:Protein kinase domain-containing protein n=1 Tax=Capsicum annuum TaxID=4072 RepID=A0A2G3AID2_CAPAN|nr:hypothetical protein FXO37_12168 [Capsicum annuum]PHT93992.1 hypothetical protein T459_01874 [Capsicum annuum]